MSLLPSNMIIKVYGPGQSPQGFGSGEVAQGQNSVAEHQMELMARNQSSSASTSNHIVVGIINNQNQLSSYTLTRNIIIDINNSTFAMITNGTGAPFPLNLTVNANISMSGLLDIFTYGEKIHYITKSDTTIPAVYKNQPVLLEIAPGDTLLMEIHPVSSVITDTATINVNLVQPSYQTPPPIAINPNPIQTPPPPPSPAPKPSPAPTTTTQPANNTALYITLVIAMIIILVLLFVVFRKKL
jgi:hypothetical protein